jgi:ERF superfamily
MKMFKADPPRISKNHRVYFEAKDRAKGPTDYKHATLDHVCDQVIGALSKVGVSHRWKVSQAPDMKGDSWITVTCILTHELGHAEETSLMGCPDATGNKNSIQAVGSTVTYLQRYTLLAACGLATSDQDNDGRGAAQTEEGLSDERIEQLGLAIANSRSIQELKETYFAAYREAQAAKDSTAKQLFMRTKDARKRELQ